MDLGVGSTRGRTGETEGRKQGRKTLVDQSTGLDMELDYGLWKWLWMECVFRVAYGESLASRLFFCFSFFLSLSRVGLSLAVYNCSTYLLVFPFLSLSFFFFTMISTFQSSPEIDMFQGSGGKEDKDGKD